MNKRPFSSSRVPLATDELENLSADDFVRLKLSDDEKSRLRQINAERARERAESVVRLRKESEPLLAELRAAGFVLENIGVLVTRSERYEQAIPILLRHLVMPYSDAIRDTIARSLAVPEPEVRKAWPLLVEEYRKAPMGWGITAVGDTREHWLGVKSGLACALSVAVTDATMEEYIALVKDRAHGSSRVLLLSALFKSKNPLGKQALEDLADDPDLVLEIAEWRKRQARYAAKKAAKAEQIPR